MGTILIQIYYFDWGSLIFSSDLTSFAIDYSKLYCSLGFWRMSLTKRVLKTVRFHMLTKRMPALHTARKREGSCTK